MRTGDRVVIGLFAFLAVVRGSVAITALLACALAWSTEYLWFAFTNAGQALLFGWLAFLLWENGRLMSVVDTLTRRRRS